MNISPFKKLILIVSIILLSSGFIISQLQQFSQDSSLSDWNSGLSGFITSMKEQRDSNKPIALFFYTDWCPNCKKLREDILSSPEVRTLMAQWIPVKINPENGPLENQLSEEFGVFGYPTFIVLPGRNKKPVLIRKTSNISPAEFVKQCRQALAT